MSLARLVASVVVAALWASVMPAAAETSTGLADLARDIRRFDGKQVTVAGTLGKTRTHVSKRGERSYSFLVWGEGGAVAVLTSTPPACRPGARVTAHGIVDGRARRVDATTVLCP
jgi:hypothetical protein